MLVFEDGVVIWGSDPLATVEQADAYAEARGWSDWAALTPEQKAVAILDASTYVKAVYRPPLTIYTTTNDQIANAIIEAARLTLTGPLLGVPEDPQVLREKVGPIEVEYAERKAGDARRSRLALIFAMLRAAGVRGASSINVVLLKA